MNNTFKGIEISDASKILAHCILHSASLRENSYDHDGADKAREAAEDRLEREKKDNPGKVIYYIGPNYMDFYRLTLDKACLKGCTEKGAPEMAEIVNNMLFTMWNDALDWARRIVGEKEHALYFVDYYPPKE